MQCAGGSRGTLSKIGPSQLAVRLNDQATSEATDNLHLPESGEQGSLVVKFNPKIALVAVHEKASAMNVGQAIRLCRTKQGASQSAIAHRANCSVSYLSMLENNKRDPTLSTVTKIAEALHVPVGLLFVLAAAQDELGAIDERIADQLMQSALASLGTSANMTTQMGGHYG